MKDADNGKKITTQNQKTLTRRKAISKMAAGAVVGVGVVAGIGGYFAGISTRGVQTLTETKTVTAAERTITETQTQTVTQTVRETVTETVAGKPELTIIKLNWWPGPESEAIGKVVDFWNKYQAQQTGVNVEMVLYGREAHADKITSLLLAGSPEPDIVFEFYLVGKLAQFLEPLDNYFNDPTLYPYTLADYFPAALDQFRVNGKLYGIPTDVSVHVLIYRKDLIKEPPKTIDELVDMARRFTKSINPGSPTEYGFIVSGKNLLFNAMLWESLLASAGGTPFEAGKEKEAIDNITNSAAQKALQVYVDFIAEGISPPDSVTYEYGEANAAFQAGKAAMYIQWNAAIGELRDKEKSPQVWDKVGIAPIPGIEKPDGTILHRSHSHYLGYSLNKASKNKKEAFKFIAWLTTTKPMLDYLKFGGFPPLRSVFSNPEAIKERTEIPELLPILSNYAYAMTNHPEVFTIYTILAKHISAAWTGQKSVSHSLSDAQNELRGIIK